MRQQRTSKGDGETNKETEKKKGRKNEVVQPDSIDEKTSSLRIVTKEEKEKQTKIGRQE